ncbi:MAG: UDP-N-acetylmuramate--L-alanine ligase [Actinomycetota bacterium]|nr:UDP-N-acetylmuramate--L-alanine ligase [Actinomycetota bacterium]
MAGETALPLSTSDPVHLIGIGGAGMSALAKVLLARGYLISGSDLKESRATYALRALGARVDIGHRPENIATAGVVVVSSAIPHRNPELNAARERGLPVLQRAQVLAMLMRERRSIAVAGTHGKTTTTSMIASVLQRAGVDPTFLIGGDLNETGTNAHAGSGEWLVAEADESDGSFLWLAPDVAVITNVEADHLDYYAGETQVRDAFMSFLENIRDDGLIIACADDPGAGYVLERAVRRVVTYGIDGGDVVAEVVERGPNGTVSVVRRAGETLGSLRLDVPGSHNVRNALAAVCAAMEAGIEFEVAAEALSTFAGVARRFQPRGSADGVTLIDDYAHHPTEIRATLASARERGWERIIAVFQPHRYSRTKHLGASLGASLADADLAVVTDVYGAGEDPEPGITGKVVVDGLLSAAPRSRAIYIPKRGDVADIVAERAEAGDLILTIGAGDVTMLADEILIVLASREAEARLDHRGRG